MSTEKLHDAKDQKAVKPLIRVDYADWIGTIAFDNYAKRNSLSADLIAEVIAALSEAVAINPGTYEYLHGLRRDVYMGWDYHEGIQAFLEKRPPKF